MVVFHVKYLRSRYKARNLSSISADIEAIFRRVNSRCNELHIIAHFPFIELDTGVRFIAKSGTLMSALRRSTKARLANKMFGKVRRFLKRAKMARKDPLPIVEMSDSVAVRVDMIT